MSNDASPTLRLLASGPLSMVGPELKARLEVMYKASDIAAVDLLALLDWCASQQITSSFVVNTLDMLWKKCLSVEGKTIEQGLLERNNG